MHRRTVPFIFLCSLAAKVIQQHVKVNPFVVEPRKVSGINVKYYFCLIALCFRRRETGHEARNCRDWYQGVYAFWFRSATFLPFVLWFLSNTFYLPFIYQYPFKHKLRHAKVMSSMRPRACSPVLATKTGRDFTSTKWRSSKSVHTSSPLTGKCAQLIKDAW